MIITMLLLRLLIYAEAAKSGLNAAAQKKSQSDLLTSPKRFLQDAASDVGNVGLFGLFQGVGLYASLDYEESRGSLDWSAETSFVGRSESQPEERIPNFRWRE